MKIRKLDFNPFGLAGRESCQWECSSTSTEAKVPNFTSKSFGLTLIAGGNAAGPGGRDRKITSNFVLQISSSYAKILGQKLFRTQEFPRSGSKAKDGERRERLNDGENNGQATHGARKHAWRTQAAWAKKSPILPLYIILLYQHDLNNLDDCKIFCHKRHQEYLKSTKRKKFNQIMGNVKKYLALIFQVKVHKGTLFASNFNSH